MGMSTNKQIKIVWLQQQEKKKRNARQAAEKNYITLRKKIFLLVIINKKMNFNKDPLCIYEHIDILTVFYPILSHCHCWCVCVNLFGAFAQWLLRRFFFLLCNVVHLLSFCATTTIVKMNKTHRETEKK